MTDKAKIVVEAEDRASAVFKRVDNSLSTLQGGVGKLGATLGAAGIATGFAAVAAAAARAIGALDDLDETAQNLGISASKLSAFQLSAQAAGVGTEQFGAALTKLNVKLSDAGAGNEQAAALFKTLGVSIKDTNGNLRTADDVLGDVADRFSTFRDGANKNALAVELFGKAGTRLITFLNEGRDGLTKFGGVSEETVQNAVRLQGEIDKLSATFSKLALTAGGALAGAINRALGNLSIDEQLERAEKRLATLREQQANAPEPGSGSIEEGNIVSAGFFEDQIAALEAQIAALNVAREAARASNDANRPDAPTVPQTKERKDNDLNGDLDRIQQQISDRLSERLTANAELSEKFREEEAERQRKYEEEYGNQLLDRVDRVRLALQTETESENARFSERLASLVLAAENEAITEAEYRELRERAEAEHQERLTAIEDEGTKKRLEISNVYRKLDINSTRSFLNTVSGLMDTQSRTQFEIGKAAAISGAVIDTYKAATGAYASLASIPIVGPFLGAAAAAAAIASGVAQVNAIRSTSFGKSSASAATVTSPPTSVSGPSTTTTESTQAVEPASTRARQQTNVTIVGDFLSAEMVRDQLIPLLNEAAGDGVDIVVSRG